jgi:hypothetical protein
MKRIVIALMACLLLAGCSTANATQEDARENQASMTMAAIARDLPEPKQAVEAPREEPSNAPESEPEQISDEVSDEGEYEYQDWDNGTAEAVSGGGYYGGRVGYSDMYNTNGPTHEMPGWYGDPDTGYVETYFNASAHYLSSGWSVDDEGFYHDSEGRYVVGVSIDDVNPDTGEQYQYGDVVQTGRGEAVVYDYGQGVDNVHDFATVW